MSIVSTTVTVDAPEIDGRHYVTEVHTDSTGKIVKFGYLAAVGTDVYSTADGRVAYIETMLAEEEAQELLNG